MAHMLIQHKAELGIKRITDVRIVASAPQLTRPDEEPNIEMVFHIADVPKEDITRDQSEEDQQHGWNEALSTNAWLSSEGPVVHRRDGGGSNVLRVHTMMG